jgi:TPR repeat protein
VSVRNTTKLNEEDDMSPCLRYSLFCLLTVLLCTCTRPPAAAEFESAKRAYAKRDYATAIKEFTAVADRGNADAQLIVGKMYMLGQGPPKDSDQAIKWYRAAADQGNADAQFFLGAMYLLPQRDIAEGLKWLRLSADQGMQDAQFLLGMSYLKGQNFTHDLVQADMWLLLAAAHGGEFYRLQRDEAEKQMTPDQIAQAKALASQWKPRVAAILDTKMKN